MLGRQAAGWLGVVCVAAVLGPPAAAQELKLRATLQGHTAAVYAMAVSPDGTTLASGASDGTIKLWDLGTGKEKATLRGHTAGVYSVAFSPDSKLLASGSDDRTAILWDVKAARAARVLKGHTKGVWCVTFSPDGGRLATGSEDTTVNLWDTATGSRIAKLSEPTPLDRRFIYAVAFRPDGQVLASAGRTTRDVTLWTLRTGMRTTSDTIRMPYRIFCLAFSPNAETLVVAGWDEPVLVWKVEADRTGREAWALAGHTGTVWAVSFSPDGRLLASGSEDQTIKLWDPESGRNLATARGHTGPVYAVAFTPNGKSLVSASEDKTIKLWDLPPAR